MQRIDDAAGSGHSRRHFLAGAGAVGAAAALAGPGANAAAAAATCEPRYFGYRAADESRPYAKYMKPRVDPPQSQVVDALARGPVPTAQVVPRSQVSTDLNSHTPSAIETGYGRTRQGEIWVACLTHMPRVEPAMWEWWFGWHSQESARYKLWHPEAHAYAGLKNDVADQPGLTDRERYLGNTSYVDETIAGELNELAIAFKDPGRVGVRTEPGEVVVHGTVGTALLPVNVGFLVHQIRPVDGGSEMRSRFYLNVPGVRAVDPAGIACAVRRGIVLPRTIQFDLRFGAGLLRHCGEEMNHLAQFLPELYAEFA